MHTIFLFVFWCIYRGMGGVQYMLWDSLVFAFSSHFYRTLRKCVDLQFASIFRGLSLSFFMCFYFYTVCESLERICVFSSGWVFE